MLNEGNKEKMEPENSEISQPKTAEKEQLSGQSSTVFYVLVIAAEVVGLLAIILIVVLLNKWMGGFAWDGGAKMFNYHPLFMVIGLVFFNGNGAITYRVLRNTPKFTAKLIHGGLQAAGFLFAILGLVAVFTSSGSAPKVYSLHSWIGIITTALFGCQFLVGFLAFLFPKFGDNIRKAYLEVHVFFGISILAMAIGACVSGLTENMLFHPEYNWSSFPAPGNITNVIGLSLIAFGVIIGYLIYQPSYKRAQSYEELK